MSDKRLKIRDYTDKYQSDYGFEYHMVRARQQRILQLLTKLAPTAVLEIGCGDDQLVEAARDCGFARWVIVEPSDLFASKARAAAVDDPRVSVIEGFFEDTGGELLP